MTMPPGYTPPAPAVDPVTGLPVGQQPPAAPPAPAPVIVQMPPAQVTPPTEEFVSKAQMEEMLARVRQEEKDKLYPQLQEQSQQLQELTREREERIAAEQAEVQRLAEEEQRRQQEEMTAMERLTQYQSEQDRRFADLEAERDRERALREREAEFARVLEYRARRMAEEAASIAPQFADYITGATEQQVEESIAAAKAKTAEIVEGFQQAQLGQRRQVAPPISGAPPVDMAGGGEGQRQLSAEDIRNMDMGEYSQLRGQLLGAASERVRTQGAYAP